MPSRAASPFCAARAATSRPAGTPDTGVRRVPNGGSTAAPAPRPAVPPATAAQPISEGAGIIPPPAPSETAQALGGSAKPLDPGRGRRAGRRHQGRRRKPLGRRARRRRQLQQPPARPLRRVEHPARRAQDRGRLRLDLALPAREPRLARARGAAPPGRGPHRPGNARRPTSCATSRPFPPLTSTGHMRRLEAAQAASPNDLKQFAERQLAQRHLPQQPTRTSS